MPSIKRAVALLLIVMLSILNACTAGTPQEAVPSPNELARIEYPLPTPYALIRHMAIDEATGDVWFSYHHVPTAQDIVARLETS